MPNNITNELQAAPEVMRGICDVLWAPDRKVDFNRLITMPAHEPGAFLAEGSLSSDDIRSHPGSNWLEWSRENWGTKWNAYCIEEIGEEGSRASETVLRFETAWNCPEPIIRALALRVPDQWTWSYADEDIGHNLGIWACSSSGTLTLREPTGDLDAWARALKGWEDE